MVLNECKKKEGKKKNPAFGRPLNLMCADSSTDIKTRWGCPIDHFTLRLLSPPINPVEMFAKTETFVFVNKPICLVRQNHHTF